MNFDELTIGEARKLSKLFSAEAQSKEEGLNDMIGEKVIVRTYSAGVHYGTLEQKSGKEVILKNSRRLWYWKTANNGISLSEVANAGLAKDSRVCASVELIWLEAVEIIPCTKEAIKNIEAANEYKA
jgi:hypothetical protein